MLIHGFFSKIHQTSLCWYCNAVPKFRALLPRLASFGSCCQAWDQDTKRHLKLSIEGICPRNLLARTGVPNTGRIDFEDFVKVMDYMQTSSIPQTRKQAGFTEEEVNVTDLNMLNWACPIRIIVRQDAS